MFKNREKVMSSIFAGERLWHAVSNQTSGVELIERQD